MTYDKLPRHAQQLADRLWLPWRTRPARTPDPAPVASHDRGDPNCWL